ncbi:hypothetical protein GCM10010885_01730 [Alicyclobacillus cellulosilyticus]|uniref:Heme exporter protein C n=1 Tax=Alicyclobacillus cellulosilyticus TaxID=1003997 RepID=A0A917K0H9_9BACL|nr:cytochrome c biogenesis protein CcsA [Alicyclobacillus cellulosilyticus]GGI95709.1 hypothetical protein GCM10010885_01730 [Alicyclobacillus cellulosilyticus]
MEKHRADARRRPRVGWFLAAAGALAAVVWADLYLALIASPPEENMGDLVRIMYFHVPCAWVALFAFFVSFIAAGMYLWRRNTGWDSLAVSSAEIGLCFTTLALITGALWARPVWGAWWTWDPRLTTTLILWFLYAGYFLLRGSLDGRERRARVSAVYGVIAFLDVPVVHMSVTWWRSIHPAVVSSQGIHMPPGMADALWMGLCTWMAVYALLLTVRYRMERQRERVERLVARVRAQTS